MASHPVPAIQAPTSSTGQSVDELILASQTLDDGTMRTQLSVPTAHCGGCMAKIERILGAFEMRPMIIDPAQMARAGSFISLDAVGGLCMERGYIRAEDEVTQEPEAEIVDPDTGGYSAGAYQRIAATDV